MLVHEVIYQGKDEQVAFTGKQQITYQQLQSQVNIYRDYFYQQGIRSGDNVGLFSKNSAEFVYSYMAIISLGAVVVPLNFQLVAREIAYIVQDAKMRIIVTMSQLALDLELRNFDYQQDVTQLVIPEFSSGLANLALCSAPLVETIHNEDICAIIYTSGTTGTPKGALLTHGNLTSNASSFTQMLPITAADHVLCVLPMYHSFAWTCAVLASLMNGATIRIVESFSIKETIATIRREGITVVYAVPAMYSLFTSWALASDFSKVKFFISGGSSLPETIAEQFYEKFSKHILEGYGLSEASPVVCLNPVEKTKYCSIGKAIPGVSVRIVNSDGQDVAEGEVGELIVRGPNVMKAYYNLPEETAQALRDGWLYTGDLAYQDSDEYFYIIDRLKDMIVISGENVYPREIEELLYAHPAIIEAAVVGIPDKLRGQAACVYVVVAEGYTLDKKVLKEYLRANLAAYKVPKEFAEIDVLPKNATGKILKKVLRKKAEGRFDRKDVS